MPMVWNPYPTLFLDILGEDNIVMTDISIIIFSIEISSTLINLYYAL
jgi:hypothetical protein